MPRPSVLQITYPCYGLATIPQLPPQANNIVAIKEGGVNSVRSANTTIPLTSWNTVAMPQNTGTDPSWQGLAYSSQLAMSVAVSSTGDAASSSDGGASWTRRTIPASWAFQDICWSPGLNLFVAVATSGPTTTKRVMTSPDGINWTERVIPDATKTLRCVCWSPDKGMFVVLGDSGYGLTSTDGITWTAIASPPGDGGPWERILWVPGTINKFVGVGRGPTNIITTSPDAVTWTTSGTLGGSGSGVGFFDLAYSPSLGMLAGVQRGGSLDGPHVSWSSNGSTWSTLDYTGLGPDPFVGIVWSKTLAQFIGVGTGPEVLSSSNGTSWTNTSAIPAPAAGSNWRRLIAGEAP